MRKILVLLGIAVLPLATVVRADTTVFDSFGPGDTYNPGFSYGIGNGANNHEVAAQFTAGASGNLATVDLGLTYFTGTNPAFRAVNVYLYGDASGLPNNANQTLLGSTTPVAEFNGITNNSVVNLSVAGSVPVTSGSLYWLVLKPTSIATTDAWNLSLPVASGLVAASFDDTTWAASNSNILPAFRLTVTSTVPDSGATILLMLGSVGALFPLQRILQNRRVRR